jgi:hypothetical protein
MTELTTETSQDGEMVTAEGLNAVGIVRYLGELGPEPTTPTLIYNGVRRGFPRGLSLKNMVQQMCNEFCLEYNAVTDPYYGLTVDQRIAAKVSRRMQDAGYTPELIAAITINQLRETPRHPEEFVAMDVVRTGIVECVYAEEGMTVPE